MEVNSKLANDLNELNSKYEWMNDKYKVLDDKLHKFLSRKSLENELPPLLNSDVINITNSILEKPEEKKPIRVSRVNY